MTLAACLHNGVVYYLQRTAKRDVYEIRAHPGRRSKLIRKVESKSEWTEFVRDLKDVPTR